MSARLERLSWLAIAVVVAVALFVAATGEQPARTPADRVRAIASDVRCPTCRGLSAAESDANAAQAVRSEIAARVEAGESDEEIRTYLASRYGDDILLKPRGTGVAGLVWSLPVAGLVIAVFGLVAAFRRWRSRRTPPDGAPTDDDRALVDHALGRGGP